MLQRQVKVALVEGLDLSGNVQDRSQHILQHIHHQADEAEQGQHQTHGGNRLHQYNGGVHLVGTGLIQAGRPVDHLVQLAHQGGQVGLNGILVIILGLDRTGRHQRLYLCHRLM